MNSATGTDHEFDGAFFPVEGRIRIPLYHVHELPVAGTVLISPDDRASLENLCGQILQMPAGHVVTGACAAHLLMAFLIFQAERTGISPLKVGLPAFSCPDLLDAVISAGVTPILYDCGPHGGIMPDSVQQAVHLGAQIIILPRLFVVQDDLKPLCTWLHDLGIITVQDDAQHFGMPGLALVGDVLLGSFGLSKRMAGIGGGVIVFRDATIATAFRIFWNHTAVAAPHNQSSCRHMVAGITRNMLSSVSPRIRNAWRKRGILPSLYPSLPDLIHARGIARLIPAHPGRLATAIAINRMHTIQRRERKLSSLFRIVRDAIPAMPGIDLIGSGLLTPPSILGVLITRQRRSDIGRALAVQGIQTTWYYYPLDRAHPSLLRTGACVNAEKLARDILILPFSCRHTENEMRQVMTALGTACHAG